MMQGVCSNRDVYCAVLGQQQQCLSFWVVEFCQHKVEGLKGFAPLPQTLPRPCYCCDSNSNSKNKLCTYNPEQYTCGCKGRSNYTSFASMHAMQPSPNRSQTLRKESRQPMPRERRATIFGTPCLRQQQQQQLVNS
jgi:hypothetical protein